MQARVTMAELAKELGVAESTVSRALRGDPRISAATRGRVKEAAARLNYRPNAMVSALMSMRRHGGGGGEADTVALITDYPGVGGWRSKDVCRWEYDGICERADRLGYRVEEFALAEYGGGKRLEKALVTRGIRGVLLGFSRNHRTELDLDLNQFSVAGLSTYFHDMRVDRANFHGLYNVRLALKEMRLRGYARTGLVVPEFNNRISGYQWSGSALDWQRHRTHDEGCPPLILEEAGAEASFGRWFRAERPDALLVYKLNVRAWLARLGVRVPQDVALAHLYRTGTEMRETAGIDGNLHLVGAAAFDLVVEALQTHRTGLSEHPKEVLIKGLWREALATP